jgi:hypothetical protein
MPPAGYQHAAPGSSASILGPGLKFYAALLPAAPRSLAGRDNSTKGVPILRQLCAGLQPSSFTPCSADIPPAAARKIPKRPSRLSGVLFRHLWPEMELLNLGILRPKSKMSPAKRARRGQHKGALTYADMMVPRTTGLAGQAKKRARPKVKRSLAPAEKNRLTGSLAHPRGEGVHELRPRGGHEAQSYRMD